MTDGRTGPGGPTLPGPVVDAAWLTEHLAAPALVVADVRWYLDGRSGLAAWEAGRIPGAVFVDVDRDLAGTPAGTEGRHPLPSPEAFAAAMTRAGIGTHTVVVAYDDTGGMTAARLWWMLHILGHPVAVLDGGLAAWPGVLETGPDAASSPPVDGPGPFAVRPWPAERIVDTTTVTESMLGRPSSETVTGSMLGRPLSESESEPESEPVLGRPSGPVLLDARSPERFRGEPNPVDSRLGHIPGARNAPWAANLDPPTGRFRSPHDLEARYRALGITEDTTVIASCGSGISACADLLALEIAGLGRVNSLYPASYSGWSADPDRPVETGDHEPAPSTESSTESSTVTPRS